jgi:cytochrome c-type biogenesis protein CcmH/NrfG
MPVASDRLAGWLSPKWLVAGVALVAEGLLVNYDLRLAAAAGALMAVVVAVWLYIAFRYGSLSGAPSVRSPLVERARQQEANRQIAAMRSGAQQRPDPSQRP